MIGAGSVVTKDIPSWYIAAGNPCKLIRKITETDRYTYFKGTVADPECEADMRRMWEDARSPKPTAIPISRASWLTRSVKPTCGACGRKTRIP